jgi:hypothetical protein
MGTTAGPRAPVGAAEQLQHEMLEMCRKTVEMVRLTWEAFRKQDTGPLQPVQALARDIRPGEGVHPARRCQAG